MCIDLIFTSQPNLSVESGTQPSHHPNCHHQIIYAKFNLEVLYPPPYTREVWHHQDSNVDLIRRSINEFDWDRAFANKHVHEKVFIFNKTVLNVLSNFIPHEVVVCDDKDPPWFNGKIKLLINEKLRTYNAYHKNIENNQLCKNLSSLQQRLHDLIDDSKQKYFLRLTQKLNTIQKSTKAYWALLKIFLNNRKIPVIPPLFHSNKFVTDFKEKAELFNSFFAKQCSLIKNDSKLPPRLHFLTDKRLSMVRFVNTDILKIIQNLNPNKAHGHDKISIWMLKICGNSLYRPSELILIDCLVNGIFPSVWKKGNIVPVHKKNDKQRLNNYRPISLLPICSKIFEQLIFNEMFGFFIENDLISQHQSGFKPGDSCINQLLSITYEIYQSFDEGFDVHSVFLDISKAFDKVWHDGIIFKLKQNGISGNLLDLLSNFLRNRKQRVVLHGQTSSWADVNAGVPQGSILGPLLFLIYVNDLADGLSSNAKLFPDDTSLFSVVHDANTTAKELNNDLVKINRWAYQCKMSFNPDPSKQAQEVIFSRKTKKEYHPPLTFNNNNVLETNSQKYLGVVLDNHLSFEDHLKMILNKVNKTIGLLCKLQNILPRSALLTIYKSFIRPHLDYSDIYMTKLIMHHFIKN